MRFCVTSSAKTYKGRVNKVRNLIVFEGIDGSGKDTQLAILKEKLEKKAKSVAVVKHPGHTDFGKAVREMILHGPQPASDLARRALFLAEALDAAEKLPDADVILMNRHMLYSNIAYGMASGSDPAALFALSAFFTRWSANALFDLVLVLDLPAEIAFRRIATRGEKLTNVEKNGVKFMERVRQNYLWLAEHRPEMRIVRCMDGERELTIDEIEAEAERLVASVIGT